MNKKDILFGFLYALAGIMLLCLAFDTLDEAIFSGDIWQFVIPVTSIILGLFTIIVGVFLLFQK